MKLKLSNYGQIAIAVAIAATVASAFFAAVEFRDTVPLLVALVAGFVALSINETVTSRRKAELAARLREQREQVYRELLDHMLQSFEGGPRKSEWEVRTPVALWGSPQLLKSYSDWRKLVNQIIRPGVSSAVPPEMKKPLQEAIAAVCQAARKDLGIAFGTEPTIANFATVFFDDYATQSDIQSSVV